MNADREQLLKKLTILDFMATDLALYLDTHPEDCEAIAYYNEVIQKADRIRLKYEKLCGPLCSYRSKSPETWDWISDPWPWKKDFNFKLDERGNFHVGV